MMILNEQQVCPYSNTCSYNSMSTCQGANPQRENKFTCEWVKDGKIIEGHGIRLSGDKTGKMKVIME